MKKEESPENITPTVTPEPATPTPTVPPAYVPPQQTAAVAPASQETTLAITSMVLGIVSVVALGLLTGIPAIITGSMALKKKQGGRGMSLTGIITGSIGTVFSLLVIAFFVFVVFLSASSYHNKGGYDTYPAPYNSSDMRSSEGTRT